MTATARAIHYVIQLWHLSGCRQELNAGNSDA
jgi:hypothetical protein